ncbi:Prolow-density lipoprotein receptor-related protein 1 [Aphelenchoides bicaudatus]|nr:Prolow-density lipoprotein receptor-related protein 1 [Aphelenchoides bicaudatus]
MPLRPMSTLVQVLHPVLSDLRKDILYFVNDTISSLKIDSTNGYLFWVSLSGLGRSRLDGSDFFRVVKHNRFVSGFAIDQNNKRLLYLERAGNKIFSIDYDGSGLKSVPKLFNLTGNRQVIFESVLVEDDVLYFAAQRQLRRVRLSDGMPKNETNTLLFNMTSTVLEMNLRLKVDEKSKSACGAKNCEHFCFAQGQGKEPKCDCVFSQLNKDGRSCDNYSSFLAYATGSKLEFTTTFDEQPGYKNLSFGSEQNQKEVQSLKPIGNKGLRMPVALASDRKQKIMFVSDTQTEQILAIPYSNESARWVLVDNVRRVEGLAFDSTNNNLYFSSDTSIQYINVKDLNETSIPRKSILVLELDKADLVRGIDVDPCSSTIYFTNWRSDEPAIEKVNFNGSNRIPFITTKIETPNAVSVDHIAKKLYWIDAHLDKIERVDFDGQNREIVLSAPFNASTHIQPINFPVHPFGLAIYKHRLYYTDWAHRAVLSVDKLLGDDVTVHRTNLINRPMGLAIVAEDMPNCGSDACTQEKISCDEKCVLDAEGHPSCDCNENSFLNPDGHSCTLWVEKGCPEMTCKDSKGCYLMEQHCDGVTNCDDGSDEIECLRPARDPCNENLCKNNGTCKLEDGIVRCYCTEEFSGMYCTHRKCEDFCLHGECKLDEFTGLPSCKCNFGWNGKHCSEKMDFCKDFCFNNGTCQEASNGVHCSCQKSFHGIRCQNCFNTNGDELACQNNGYCLSDRSGCRCVDGFNGDECQNDPCTKHPCLNGGLCKRRADSTTYCKCPPKYEGLHCQLDFCETNPGYCKNGGVCVHGGSTKNADSDDVQCLCPDSFTGKQCEERRSCSDYCLNGATCTAFKSNNFECHCAHGFYGHRCEHNYACKLDCAYGECVKQDNGSHVCKCPKGISLITDYLGHKSCSQYSASNCSELDCGSNGECVEILQKSGSRPSFQCLCKDGWTGMLCEFPSCYNYCEKGARCSVLDGHPYCTCEKGQFGARCNQRITDYNFLKATHNRSMTIMLPAILLILATVSVAYFAVLKKHGISFIGVQKQFQHTRMRNEETASEFQNPAFSNEDENLANELPSSHLIDGGSVYNDTIIRNGSSSSKSNIEKFNLLSKT